MHIHRIVLILLAGGIAFGQTRARPGAASKPQVPATLGQLMKGILYPSSNVIFAAQGDNPADVPPAKDPSMSVNLLASTYGKWEAVENSSLAIAEAANLLVIPGRKCSNGLRCLYRMRIGRSSCKGSGTQV